VVQSVEAEDPSEEIAVWLYCLEGEKNIRAKRLVGGRPALARCDCGEHLSLGVSSSLFCVLP
jgi:hypothetical protein